MDGGFDTPRFLARRSELGYVPDASRALPGAGEAVAADYQDMLVQRAHQTVRDRKRDELVRKLDEIDRRLRHYEAQARHCARMMARIRRRLDAL